MGVSEDWEIRGIWEIRGTRRFGDSGNRERSSFGAEVMILLETQENSEDWKIPEMRKIRGTREIRDLRKAWGDSEDSGGSENSGKSF